MAQKQPVSSPWWYRRRDAVFGMIYGAGFFLGGVLSGFLRGGYVPFYIDLAARLHTGRAVTGAAAAAFMFAGWALRVWGSSYLRARIVWSENARTDALIVAGPFRYTRNPLYLGNMLMALGMGAIAPAAGWLFINLGTLIFNIALIRWEELGLRARYGEAFDDFCRKVPQLLPRLLPAPASGRVDPSLAEGLRAEIFVGSLSIGMVVLLLRPGMYGWVTFAVLYVLGIVLQYRIAGAKEKTEQVA
ncbi:MAG TPA: isoprenylcysteine carboxylmethyltransferase family protein [Candidatus Baltobacteraceae bacterium]|nr:isoprenylcysteine carboxylmethyltransferase family protein [Candidatus Baltobacteraceae bacterium]